MKKVVLAILAVAVLAVAGCYEVKNSTVVNNYYGDSNSVVLAEEDSAENDPNQVGIVTLRFSFGDVKSEKRGRKKEDSLGLISEAQAKKVSSISIFLNSADYQYNFHLDKNQSGNYKIRIGEYKIEAYASIQIGNYHYPVFHGEKNITVNKGVNPCAMTLVLKEFQPIAIYWPDNKLEECIRGSVKRPSSEFIAYFCPSIDYSLISGIIPIDAEEVIIQYRNRAYTIDLDAIMNYVLLEDIIYLDKCDSEELASIEFLFEPEVNELTAGTRNVVLVFKVKSIGYNELSSFRFRNNGDDNGNIEEITLSDYSKQLGTVSKSCSHNWVCYIFNSDKIVGINFSPIAMSDGEEKIFALEVLLSDAAVPENSISIELIDEIENTEVKQISPVFVIADGTLQISSNEEENKNIVVANDQCLGSYEFVCRGEEIAVYSLDLVINSTNLEEDAILNVELVNSDGVVVAGPTDPVNGVVYLTDTFVVPVRSGSSTYQVRGDLQTSASWISGDTIYTTLDPLLITATGEMSGNDIIVAPDSLVNSGIRNVKTAELLIYQCSSDDFTVVANQKDVVLSSWSFDTNGSGEDVRVTSIIWTGQGAAAFNTNTLTTFIDVDKNGIWNESIDIIVHPIEDRLYPGSSKLTFAFEEPIIIPKDTRLRIALKGDKDPTEPVEPNNTECWGLTDDTLSVIAYGVDTGNSVAEHLVTDKGPTITSINRGTLIVNVDSYPARTIVIAGSTDNTIAWFRFRAQDEDIEIDEFVVYVANGDYECAEPGDYKDILKVSVYYGETKLAEASIPSTNSYTFNFSQGEFVIPVISPHELQKEITVKIDVSTIDPDMNDAPGTANANFKIGIKDVVAHGLKSNNNVIVIEDNPIGRSKVLRNSNLYLDCSCSKGFPSYNPRGAATELTNGYLPLYTVIAKADSRGGSVLLYKLTYEIETDVELFDWRLEDQHGNNITKTTHCSYSSDRYLVRFHFNNPDFDSGPGLEGEAIEIPSGESREIHLYARVSEALPSSYLRIRLVKDNVCESMNTAENIEGNFVWSDNYKQLSISNRDALLAEQWYNSAFLYPHIDYYGWYFIPN